MTFEPLEVHTDPQFPAITAEIVEVVFAALRQGLPADVQAPDTSGPAAAWKAVGHITRATPFPALSDALKRVELAEGPHAAEALYAFTWGVYHSRAEDQIFAGEG